MILKESVKLRAFSGIEYKYALILKYWEAVSRTCSRECGDSREYFLLRVSAFGACQNLALR